MNVYGIDMNRYRHVVNQTSFDRFKDYFFNGTFRDQFDNEADRPAARYQTFARLLIDRPLFKSWCQISISIARRPITTAQVKMARCAIGHNCTWSFTDGGHSLKTWQFHTSLVNSCWVVIE